MIQRFQNPDTGEIYEAMTRQQAEKLISDGYVRVPASTVFAQPGDSADSDPNASSVTVENLIDMTINAQFSYLQGLSDSDLSMLQERETRKRALDNIADELERRTAPDDGSE